MTTPIPAPDGAKPKKQREFKPEPVLKDYGDIGRYKFRKIKTPQGPIWDLREFVESDTYTGFTKKGVRLTLENIQRIWDLVADAEGIRV